MEGETTILNKIENNKRLTKEEIAFMVNGFLDKSVSENVMSKFLLLVKEKGLSYKETFYLTDAMIKSGEVLDLSDINKVVVDKHSTGGVGDKVTFFSKSNCKRFRYRCDENEWKKFRVYRRNY